MRANEFLLEKRLSVQEIVYHGSDIDFDAFDFSKTQKGNDYGLSGKGMYFTSSLRQAKAYGKYIKQVKIQLKNPLDLSKFKTTTELSNYLNMDDGIFVKHEGRDINILQPYAGTFTSAIKDAGHDSVISPTRNEIVVYYPEQIISINNIDSESNELKEAVKKPIIQNDAIITENTCVPLAIATVTGLDQEHINNLCDVNDKFKGMYSNQWKNILRDLGIDFKIGSSTYMIDKITNKILSDDTPIKIGKVILKNHTLGSFIKLNPTGKFLIGLRDHLIAVIDGKIHDTENYGLKHKINTVVEII